MLNYVKRVPVEISPLGCLLAELGVSRIPSSLDHRDLALPARLYGARAWPVPRAAVFEPATCGRLCCATHPGAWAALLAHRLVRRER